MDVVAGLGEVELGVGVVLPVTIGYSLDLILCLQILNNRFRFIVLEMKMYYMHRNFYNTNVCLISGLLGRTRCPRERCYGQPCWDSLRNPRLHSGIKQEIP